MVSTNPPEKAKEKRPKRGFASQVYFAKYENPNVSSNSNAEPEWQMEESLSGSGISVWYRYSRFGLLTLVNSGPNNRGYRLCTYCGYAEPTVNAFKKPKGSKPHKNPRTGKDCRGFFETVHLGHDFITDTLEIQFRGTFIRPSAWEDWLSILYAILEGSCDALNIKRDDLNATLYWNKHTNAYSLILYDKVAGGAGYVAQVSEHLPSVIEHAYQRVAHCECGEETSCYNCLRSYNNQINHARLKRGIASTFLKQICRP